MEFYKNVAEYGANIVHKRSGRMYDVKALVREGLSEGRFIVSYSHTFKPTEGAAFYFSDSYTSACSVEEAECLVRGWFQRIEGAFEIGQWSDNL